MQASMKFNLNNLNSFSNDRKMWVMDTSHHHILNTVLNSTNRGLITVDDHDEKDGYVIWASPKVTNNGKNEFADNTFMQYIRTLIFFGVIDYNILITNNIKNWTDLRKFIIENGIEINISHDYKEYLAENIKFISENIKEMLKLDNFISKDTNTILSTAEFFLNYNEHAIEYSVDEIVKYFSSYELKISQLRSDSNINSIYGEYLSYARLFDLYEAIFNELLEIEISSEDDIFKTELNFEGYGYLGELVTYFYLKSRFKEIEWVSRRDKRSNHDFRADDYYIEVKTSTIKKSKVSFNLSWNEYVLQQNNKDKYFIYYIDGLYNVKDLEKNISKNLDNIDEFVKKNNIKIEIIDQKLFRKYEMVSKGYWITELK